MRLLALVLGICAAAAFLGLSLSIQAHSQAPAVDGFLARSYHSPTGEAMQYRLFVPPQYSPTQRFPLVLCLHNAAGRSDDNLAPFSGANTPGTHIWTTPENQARYPTFVLAPQLSETKAWARPHAEAPPVSIRLALEFLNNAGMRYSIDLDRVYVAGQSMGGRRCLATVSAAPGRFAAAVALCGYGFDDMIPRVAKTHVWIFQGEADEIVPVERAHLWVAALRKVGGLPKYTEVPGWGHNLWEQAFADPDVAVWLMSHRRGNVR